jgi:flagellum-specific peptidoglycan hydrolase FlgJ/LysM repeat protein
MKLKNLVKDARFGLVLLAVTAQLFTACSGSKKATASKIPKSYGTTAAKGTNAEARLLYLDIYKAIAIREMERTGIPASIKLAQGVLESDAGRSELASKYNNHFGIKCHSDWTGERFYKEDDDKDPVTGQLIKSCFRAYKNSEESFIAHSEFLRDPRKVNRYGFLFQLDKRDYQSWANGLERAGYATATDYSEKLIRLIEDLQLSQYDQMSSGDLVNSTKPSRPRPTDPFDVPSGNIGGNASTGNANTGTFEGENNNTRFVKVTAPLTLEQVAGRYDISVKKLKDYNEEIGEAESVLKSGSIVYLQAKRNKFNGEAKYHRVAACETMFDISQKYGIKLAKLYRKNEMREGDQPQVGEKIILRRGLFQRFDMPALRDTFGEFRKCEQPEAPINQPSGQPTTGTRPASGSRPGDFPFEITPGSQPSTSYPQNQSGYPQSSYPPSTQPTYTNSGNTTTYPSSGYPSGNANSYPTTTTDYPAGTIIRADGTIEYPNGTTNRPNTGSGSTTTANYPSYPSYPSTNYPSNQPTTQPTTKPKPKPNPQAGTTTQPPVKPKPTGAVQYHTVAQSETLWAISRKYGITVDQLKQLNGLADNIIKPGQQLRVK